MSAIRGAASAHSRIGGNRHERSLERLPIVNVQRVIGGWILAGLIARNVMNQVSDTRILEDSIVEIAFLLLRECGGAPFTLDAEQPSFTE